MKNSANTINANMKVLQSAEYFEKMNDEYRCKGTLIVCQHEKDIFHGRVEARAMNANMIIHGRVEARAMKANMVSYHDLIDIIKIPSEAYQPLYQDNFTLATNVSECYIKRPRLISYDYYHKTNSNRIADIVLEEMKIYEILQHYSHPNIAQYFGCLTAEDRIVGICLAQYPTTLMTKVNPEHRMKRQAVRYRLNPDVRERYVNKLRNALQHLHSLGLVHNDINPSNIMLDDQDEPVIIDFDSCCSIGHSLDNVGRTYEWHDPTITIARPEHDMDALNEIHEWLSHKVERNFKFAE